MPTTNRHINKQTEQKRVLNKLGTSIRTRPFLCFALMLFWSWLNIAYQSPLFFPPVMLSTGFQLSTWFAPIAASALAYFILGIWFKRTNMVISQPWYIGAVAGLMTLGALLCFLWINGYGASLDTAANIVLYLVGSLTIGFGTALLMIEWGRIFGYLGPQEVLAHGMVAMLGSALLVGVLSFLPSVVGQLIFVLIPAPLVACLYRTLRDLPLKSLYNHGLDAELKTPHKFLVTALLHGLSLGVMMGSVHYMIGQSSASLLTALSFVAAAILLLLTAVFVKMDFNHLIYQIGFGITATGAFLIACFGVFPILGISFQLIGFCYVHLIMWGLCSYLTKHFRLPATWVIAWPTCCLMLGQLLGGVTTSFLVQQPEGVVFWIQTMATVMMFVLLMASLIMISNRNQSTGWGIATPATYTSADNIIETIGEKVGVEHNLTPRESEIFILMARGRNRKVISQELVISEETTKSHINGIYRKLGIHSQQELLDLTEALKLELQGETESTVFE